MPTTTRRGSARASRKPAGFMSERTAEYVLVSDLCERLRTLGPTVVPFSFHSGREGHRFARAGVIVEAMVAAYARRPKIAAIGSSQLSVKINALLRHDAFLLQRAGIPVLAGVPLVSRLCDMTLGARSLWFQVLPDRVTAGDDGFATISLEGSTEVVLDAVGVRPLDGGTVQALVQRIARPREWNEVLDDLGVHYRDLRESEFAQRSWFGSLTYRPFYVAVLRAGDR